MDLALAKQDRSLVFIHLPVPRIFSYTAIAITFLPFLVYIYLYHSISLTQNQTSLIMGYCNLPVTDDYEVPEDVPTIRSSQGKDVDSSSVSWMEPVDLWTPLKEMRKRYNREGYIWIKNLLPREDVLAMREQ